MNGVKEQALQKYAKMINTAEGEKEAIIKTAEFDDKYAIAKEEHNQEKEEVVTIDNFEFNPDEIEPLVNRNRKSFRESLEVKEENLDFNGQIDLEDEFYKPDDEREF